MKSFWDDKYAIKEFAYGKEPNLYFKEQLLKLKPGKILLPAEGEGRNAVFAAKNGWDVSAFDQSTEAKKKAEILATENKVILDYKIADLDTLGYQKESFDVIGFSYAHFPADIKEKYYPEFKKLLKKGGIVIFEAFSKNHLKYNSVNIKAGGPKEEAMLFSVEELQTYFSGFEIIELLEMETELHEGLYHNGISSVIRFTGKKL